MGQGEPSSHFTDEETETQRKAVSWAGEGPSGTGAHITLTGPPIPPVGPLTRRDLSSHLTLSPRGFPQP